MKERTGGTGRRRAGASRLLRRVTARTTMLALG
jgi:hypothetical protein